MIRYVERSPSRRAWLILLGLCVVAWSALMLAEPRAVVPATILVGMFGAIAALTLYSTGRFGNITLTDDELKVGRERIRLTDLYPWGVTMPGDHVQGKLVGGAYASTLGTHVIGLTRRDGKRLVVQSKDPDALRAALEHAMAPFRTDA